MEKELYIMDINGLNTLLRKEKGISFIMGMATTVLIIGLDQHQDEIKDWFNGIANKIKNHKSKKEAMEEMSEKITNMTMNGASDEELEAAIRESKDVIDSYK